MLLYDVSAGLRFEDKIYTRLDKPHPHRTTAHELLAAELARAGNEFGTETQYGKLKIAGAFLSATFASDRLLLLLHMHTPLTTNVTI